MKTCPKCGGENLAAANVCRLCDTELPKSKEPASVMPERAPVETSVRVATPQSASSSADRRLTCPACHIVIDADWPFCQNCGNRLAASSEHLDLASQMRAALPISQSLDSGKSGASKVGQPSQSDASGEVGPKPVRGPGPTETGPQPPGRQSERNLGLTTSIVCAACGSIQPAGGAFCADCGAQLSAEAIARALAKGTRRGSAALHLITDGGQVGESYRLDRPDTLIGRAEGDMIFPHDSYMSVRHARIVEREGRYFLIDENSRNGSFIRIGKETELEAGDTFLVGKQVLKFETK